MSTTQARTDGSPAMNPIQVLIGAIKRFGEQDMPTYAAALAFQAFFSVFPFLLFLIALLAFLNVPQFFDWLTTQVSLVVPPQAIEQVMGVIDQVRTPNSTLLSFGMGAALWAASASVREAMAALSVSAGVFESRSFPLRVLLSLIYTVLLAALLIASALLFSVGPQAANWLAAQFGLDQTLALIWSWLRLPLLLVLLALSVTLLYYAAPARRQPLRSLLPGATLSVVTWVLASLAFSWYLTNFANYSAVYGSIGTIIAVMFYFLVSASVLLFGAQVNAVLSGRPERPGLSGDPRT
jgi:membrane protein